MRYIEERFKNEPAKKLPFKSIGLLLEKSNSRKKWKIILYLKYKKAERSAK